MATQTDDGARRGNVVSTYDATKQATLRKYVCGRMYEQNQKTHANNKTFA
jgi:hypothetical protein